MKFSVIVPVYKVESYLGECIDSVLAQTMTDFELILVDDCSPDGCPALCDEYAKKDDRIKVIHKPHNEGLGFARNTGIEAARGERILFVDSDDFIAPDTLEICSREAGDKTDVLVFGVRLVHQNAAGQTVKEEVLLPEEYESHSPQDTARAFILLNKARIYPFAWNKVYSRSFINDNGLRFEKTKLIEDFLFNIAAFSKTDAIKIIPVQLYNYRKPAHETLVSAYAPEFFELCKRKYLLEKDFLLSHDALTKENSDFIAYAYIKHFVSTIIKNGSPAAGLSKKEQKEKIKAMLDDPLTEEILSGFTPSGAVQSAICKFMQQKNAELCYMTAKIYTLV